MFEKEITAGMVALDAVKPDWWRMLNLTTLDLGNIRTCVLGQLFRGFGHGMITLETCGVVSNYGWERTHGFCLMDAEFHHYGQLTTEWVQAIQARRDMEADYPVILADAKQSDYVLVAAA